MSPQESEIARFTPNELEMKAGPLSWLQSHPAFHIIQKKWLDFL